MLGINPLGVESEGGAGSHPVLRRKGGALSYFGARTELFQNLTPGMDEPMRLAPIYNDFI